MLYLLHISCEISGSSNSHSGYCSGNECERDEHSSEKVSFMTEADSKLLGELIAEDGTVNEDKLRARIALLHDEILFSRPTGSGACGNSDDTYDVHETNLEFEEFELTKVCFISDCRRPRELVFRHTCSRKCIDPTSDLELRITHTKRELERLEELLAELLSELQRTNHLLLKK